jgi:hypothetical protein
MKGLLSALVVTPAGAFRLLADEVFIAVRVCTQGGEA